MAINKETILSAYNDKLTLLEWLKKVETALDEGVVTNLSIMAVGNNAFKFKIGFQDGTSLESNEMLFPKSFETLDVRDTLYVHDNIEVGGNLEVTNDTQLENLTCDGEVNLNGITHISNARFFENIEDENGKNRFIAGNTIPNGLPDSITIDEILFNKWSLSGTHLMIVLCGIINNDTPISRSHRNLCHIPNSSLGFIADKIVADRSTGRISWGTLYLHEADQPSRDIFITKDIALGWDPDMVFIDFCDNELDTTLPAGTFRLQFDLLID